MGSASLHRRRHVEGWIRDASGHLTAAILGMLGSDAPGERDNAARLAERFRRQHDTTWLELLTPPPPIILWRAAA